MPNISASYGAITLTSRRQDNWGNWSEAAADAVFTFPAIPAGAQVSAATLTIQVGQDPIAGSYMTVDGQSVRTSVGTYAITIQVPAGTGSRTVRVSFKGTGKTYSTSQVGITSMTLAFSYIVPMSAWSLTKAQVAAGEAIGVNITTAVSTARHKVTYALGSQSAAYELAAGVTSHSYTLPMAWCAQLPNATYGTGTVTLQTMDASGSVLGTESKNFTMTVPGSVVPTLESLTVEGVNLKWGLYLQGISSAKAVAGGAAGAKGSTIRSYTVEGGGYSALTSELTTGTLETAGENIFRATVTDSRGRMSADKEEAVTVTAYSRPKITSAEAKRCLADGTEDDAGTYLRCVIGYSWTAAGENAVTVTVKARATGTETWSQLYEGVPESGSALVLGDGGILEANGWEVLVMAEDAIAADQVSMNVPTAHTFFVADPQNDSFAFGCYPEGGKRLRMAEDWELHVHGKEFLGWMEETATPEQVATAAHAARARNLLVNSWWGKKSEIVNQRGQSSYTGAVYGIDMWRSWQDDNTLDIGEGYIDHSQTICQYVELLTAPTKPYTMAVMRNDGRIAIWSGVPSEEAEAPDGVMVAYSAGAKRLCAIITNANGSVVWAALYEGAYTLDTLPPYVPKGYAAELMECKRYCRTSDWGTAHNMPLYGYASSATQINAFLPTDVPMRAVPSISDTSGGNWLIIGNGGRINPTSVSTWFAGENAIGLRFTCTGAAENVPYIIVPASAAVVVLSADL